MSERDSELKRALSRAEILTESVKGLLLVNGGGAVALLAFLQAIWSQDKELARVVLWGIAMMGGGLVFALLVQPFRVSHSKIVEREGDRKTVFWFSYVACQYLSVLAFAGALGYLVYGGLEELGARAETQPRPPQVRAP